MNIIEMRVVLRVPEDLYNFLLEESRLRKLSFEGLILLYIKERMELSKKSEYSRLAALHKYYGPGEEFRN